MFVLPDLLTELRDVINQANHSCVSVIQIALLSTRMLNFSSFSSQNNLYLPNSWLALLPGNHTLGFGSDVLSMHVHISRLLLTQSILVSAFQKEKG